MCRRVRTIISADIEVVVKFLLEKGDLLLMKGSTVSNETLETCNEEVSVVHLVHHMPIALSRNRGAPGHRCTADAAADFIAVKTFRRLDDGTIVFFLRSCSNPAAPARPDCVRGHIVLAGFVIRPLQGVILRSAAPFLRNCRTCSLTYIAQVDPRGFIPHWLTNLVMETEPQMVADIRGRAEAVSSTTTAASVIQRFAKGLRRRFRSDSQYSNSSMEGSVEEDTSLQLTTPTKKSRRRRNRSGGSDREQAHSK